MDLVLHVFEEYDDIVNVWVTGDPSVSFLTGFPAVLTRDMHPFSPSLMGPKVLLLSRTWVRCLAAQPTSGANGVASLFLLRGLQCPCLES